MEVFYRPNCPVCGNNNGRKTLKINYHRDSLVRKLDIIDDEPVYLLKCNNCSHHYASPQIHPEVLNAFYADLDSEYLVRSVEPSEGVCYQNQKLVNELCKLKPTGKVLDVGCGFGFFLNRFETSEWERYGVDPSKTAIDFLRSKFSDIISHEGYLTEQTFPGVKFDLILCFDVFEHLSDPNYLLKVMKYYLKKDGLLVVGSGNIKSLNFYLTRQKWGYFGSHEHISFFSRKSLNFILNSNGLKIKKFNIVGYTGSTSENFIRLAKNAYLVIMQFLGFKDIKQMSLALDHFIAIIQVK